MSQDKPKLSIVRVRRKRTKAALTILATMIGTGAVTLNPTSDIETAKQIFITIANVAMCLMVWDIYFEEKSSQKKIHSICLELLVITLSSIFTAYILARGITALMNFLIQTLGLFGWGLSGILSGLGTGLLGLCWTVYCDDWYRNSKS